MIKYMNQYAAESQELKQFEEWWKKQNDEAIMRIQRQNDLFQNLN